MCGLAAVAAEALRALYCGQHEIIQRQAEQHMRRRPCQTGVAPTDGLQSPGGQRPADGAGETGDQRDSGDRAARGVAIDAAQRAESRVIQAKPHADAEQQPGENQHRDRMGAAEQRKARGQCQIGGRQHLAAADQIDLPPDARAEQGGDHQRGREGGEDPVAGNAEIVRDRVGQNSRQIITRRPCQGLCGAERQNDRKLAFAHGSGAMVIAGCGGHAVRIRSCVLARHLHTPRRGRQPRRNFDETIRGNRSKHSRNNHGYPANGADHVQRCLSRWLRYRLCDNV